MDDGAEQGRPPALRLEPDCAACAALCCAVFAFDKSESFGIDKGAGEVCPNLSPCNSCRIFDAREALGFKGCITYTCHGAGQRVTQEVFGGRSWRDDPSLMHRMGASLTVLRRIHEQLAILEAAGALPLSAEEREKLEALKAGLSPAGGFDEASLADYPIQESVKGVSAFLGGLQKHVK